MNVNLLLFLSTVALLALLAVQMLVPEAGDHKHRTGGRITLLWAVVFVVLAAIRGDRQAELSGWYIAHLITALIFFLALVMTAYCGWRQLEEVADEASPSVLGHWLLSKVTVVFFVTSVILLLVAHYTS